MCMTLCLPVSLFTQPFNCLLSKYDEIELTSSHELPNLLVTTNYLCLVPHLDLCLCFPLLFCSDIAYFSSLSPVLGKPHLAHFKAKLCYLLVYKHLPEGVRYYWNTQFMVCPQHTKTSGCRCIKTL